MIFCLLGATFSTNNMGVGALTAGAIEAILHQFPYAEISLLDYGKKRVTYQFHLNEQAIPVKLINLRFSKKIYLKNNIALLLFLAILIRLIPLQKVRNKIYSLNDILRQISQADIFASIAGGDSFSDIYGLERLLYVSLPQFLVLFMRKKLFMLPQTLGPFNGKTAKSIARYILKRARLIYSRDYAGLDEMRELLDNKTELNKFRFCYDVGFVIQPVQPRNLLLDDFILDKKSDKPLVGVNVSGLLFMGGYTHNNMFGLKVDYRNLIHETIDFVIRKKKANVLLVPHVFGRDNPESDAAVCAKLYNDLKSLYGDRISLVEGGYNQNEIKYIIGHCDFFIGSRMHACIAALSQHIPAVTIAYSRKFIGVLQSIAMESLVADPRIMSSQEIIKIIDTAYDNRSQLRLELLRIMPEVKKAVYALMRDIYLLSQN